MAASPLWLTLLGFLVLVLVGGLGWIGSQNHDVLSHDRASMRSLKDESAMRNNLSSVQSKRSLSLVLLRKVMKPLGGVAEGGGGSRRISRVGRFNGPPGHQHSMVRRSLNYLSCGTGNPIDDCWRCDPNWHKNRKRLADCGIGFGRNAIGGRDGHYYVVSDPNDYDPVNPRPGTLRHAVIQEEPLWIIFKRDMAIRLKQELIINSFKTIDGRGANVHIANGACLTIQFVTNVIIHGVHIHDCKPTGNAMVRSSPSHYGWRTMADGDAVSIFGSSDLNVLNE
ncbi:hypothetical protein M5K25_010327 [Dendrobium thyrsiflorum]|uniref:Pectate lyase n=1 Tax=Dendrobium thyrsiflorum TaxID=117978 RepID=A0ABD0UZX5_DENTH